MENETQFINRRLKILLEELKIKKHFTLVEDLQANHQVEAAIQVLVRGLK